MRRIIGLATLTLCGLAASPATAFDGDRRGFLFGLAGGAHTSDAETDLAGASTFDDTSRGLALRLTLGGGVSENLTVYAIRDTNLEDDDASFGLLGIGSTFYFGPNGPAAYLHGAIGLGDVTIEDVYDDGFRYRDLDVAYGLGMMFGGGFAFTQGFHVDGSLMYVEATDDENFTVDVDYEFLSIRIMAGYTWY